MARATPTFEAINAFALGPQQPVTPVLRDSSGNIYGTATGGARGAGSVYKIATDGTITTLYNFSDAEGYGDVGLVAGDDGNFYGAARMGGIGGNGMIYRITPAGVFTKLYAFTGDSNGGRPSGLAKGSDGYLYGTTTEGGANSRGTVFKISTSGVLTTLNDWADDAIGWQPDGPMFQAADGNFYGTNRQSNDPSDPNAGTLFCMTPAGSLSLVTSFASAGPRSPHGVIQASDGNFYGSSRYGGPHGAGTVYQVTPAGATTVLASFDTDENDEPLGLLTEGADGALYGTSYYGGAANQGSVFKVTKAGVVTTLVSMVYDTNRLVSPVAGLILGSDGNFYGTVQSGGDLDGGVVFQMTPGGTMTNLASFDACPLQRPDTKLLPRTDGSFYGTTFSGRYSSFSKFQLTTAGEIVSLGDMPLDYNPNTDSTCYDGLLAGIGGDMVGTSVSGGDEGVGYAFKLETDGTVDLLHGFGEGTGFFPTSLAVGSDGNYYGTTSGGDVDGNGTFFTMTSSGDVTSLAQFDWSVTGGMPTGGLFQASDGNFYGTTMYGGPNETGVIYKATSGGTLTALATFGDGSDGLYYPQAGLIEGSDGSLYGLCRYGGPEGYGSAYKVELDGTLTSLAEFDDLTGGEPIGELVEGPDGAFYGVTYGAGAYGQGTVFRLTAAGVLTSVHDFNYEDGAYPIASLVKGLDGDLYGTTSEGGTLSSGVFGGGGQVFRIHFGAEVTTEAASALTAATATTNATVNPGGYATTVTFEYGTSPTLAGASTVSGGVIPAGTSDVAVTGALTGLAPGTTYYFRALATNAETPVVQKGEILSFTTAEAAHIGVSASGHAVADGGKVIAGWAVTGHSKDVTLTIQNTSTSGTLTGIAASISGGDASQFTVLTAPAATLAPGATTTAVIRFTPASSGIKGTTLAITSSDPDDASHEVLLRGAGLTPAEARVAALIRWILSQL
ncbi:MAG: hypothetical protein QM755_24545 [Luteolibacter sp.]